MMGGSSSTRWRDYEGRWHEGFPPPGWYQAPNGHWYPQPPPSSQRPATDGEASPAARVVAAYGRWPLWAQIGTPIIMAFLFLGAVGAMVEPRETVETSDKPEVVERTTTTTTRPTTTTTTVVTTTAPPATVPPTVPPTAPPPTAAPPPPPPPQPVVVEEPPPVEEDPGGGCHPSYTPCVPFAADVDCAGGSGNGPAYVDGPVYIVDGDPYGLDGNDNDGVGCE